ncbi:MAG: hypothetical protein V9H26_10555 [Verrucomicrobiota bacterium]
MKNDIFADIGAGDINTRRGQIRELTPLQLPRKFLTASKSVSEGGFSSRSEAGLGGEVARGIGEATPASR